MIEQARGAMQLLGRARFAGSGVFVTGLIYQLVLHFEDDTANAAVGIPLRVAIIVVIQIVFYTLVKFGRQYVLPVDRGGYQILKAVLILIAAAALRGLMLHSLTNTFHLYNLDSLPFRVTNSIQVMVLVYGIIGLSDQGYREWKQRKNDLLVGNARLTALLRLENEKSQQDHQRLIDMVSGQLLRFVRDVERSTPENIVANLRGGIANIVRPLSREVDARDYVVPAGDQVEAKVSWRQIIHGIGTIRPIEPVVVPALLLIAAFPYLNLHFGTANAFAVSLVVIVLGITILGVFDIVGARLKLGWIGNWLWMILASLTTAVLVDMTVVAMLRHGTQPVKLLVILATFINVVTAMIAMNKSLFKQIGIVEEELLQTRDKLTWALARETEVQRQRSRALAMALHGPVQTAVGAGIIRLENAAKLGAIPDELILEVSDLIYASLEQLQSVTAVANLDQVFQELSDTWDGITVIRTTHSKAVQKRIQEDSISASLIAECIPELAFNAIKHGEAKTISIELLKPRRNSVQVVMEDDGTKFVAGPKQGLGLKHLNESALAVKRDYINGRNLTTITLPYQSCSTSGEGSPKPAGTAD